jgi:excinuclease ABC subunit B
LLREGLDLPEVELIGILDADKEGFLRSETSLIQIIGRAARNVAGRVILYADNMTGSMERAIKETERRRNIQIEYNRKHGITPATIIKQIRDITEHMQSEHRRAVKELADIDLKSGKNRRSIIAEKRRAMKAAVKDLNFETAALLRDEIILLEKSH